MESKGTMFRGLRPKKLFLLLSLLQLNESDCYTNKPSAYDKVIQQVNDFEIALKAMDYLLDDRSKRGISMLHEERKKHGALDSDQPAAIFTLALGVTEFIEATLGFEPEVMSRAHNTLSEAENDSLENGKYNMKHKLATSFIYPPGTEFQVTYAELTLLNALLMLLHENNGMVEGAKALLKLRRAYQTLDSIYKKTKEVEPLFNKNLAKFKKQGIQRNPYTGANISAVDLPGYSSSQEKVPSESPTNDLELLESLEKIYQLRKARIEGLHIQNDTSPYVDLYASSTGLGVSLPSSAKDNSLSLHQVHQRQPSPSAQPGNSIFRNVSNNGEQHDELGDSSLDSDEEFQDASDNLSKQDDLKPSHIDAGVSILSLKISESELYESGSESNFHNNEDSNYLHVSTTDEFIHSGVQLCFGILQVVLSLIPPTIGKVLSIVGFRGDRDTGLKLLWKTAITTRNIHSELALLCLLVFYDGPLQFIDNGYQLPDEVEDESESTIDLSSKTSVTDNELQNMLKFPDRYTPQLLLKARKTFPHNALWLLEEGRMLASKGHLEKATHLMQSFSDDPNNKIEMEQIEALLCFDRAMMYAFRHDYELAARDFIHLTEINSWSKSLYLFFAASCYLAKWRMIQLDLDEGVKDKELELKKWASEAEKYFKESPKYVPGHGSYTANKKGGIGGGNKQMPFDKFLLRKLSHVAERQKKNPDLSYIDCFGTSPIHELVYFWNGFNRMTERELNLSLKILGYSGASGSVLSENQENKNFAKFEETEDEAMIRYFLQSISLRLLGKISEGLSILDSEVLSKYVLQGSQNLPFKYKRMTYSPYLYPTALYEKSVFIWLLRTSKNDFDIRHLIKESKFWVKNAETVSNVGDYELSNRTSMKIKAAADRLAQLELTDL